jgi:RimJ/RimL family protein N-acetyltransferase
VTTLPSAGPLAGRWVQLDLLGEPDLDEMYPVLADPAVYAHGYVMHRRPASVADARELTRSVFLAQQGEADGRGGGRTAYAIRLMAGGDLGAAGTLVGTTALSEADLRNESIKIQTDTRNTRSQAAIEKLGAHREGVMRRHMKREDGTFRDTVVYSVLIDEWPGVKARLTARLAR